MALVISAFPGCGKTEAAKNQILGEGAPILDLDSSSFSWLAPGVRNPEFPQNYIDKVKESLEDNVIIFVSSHTAVRKALHANDIPFILVWPKPDTMWSWIGRFFDRGDRISFIEAIMDNWFHWLDDAFEEEEYKNTPVIWLDEKEYISSYGVMGKITKANLYREKLGGLRSER